VALTFDAGEGAGHTEQILDMLAEYGIKGTFGVTGQWAEQNPDLMLRIVAEGHQIINHTYDHQSYTGVSTGTGPMDPAEFRDDVERTEQIIEDVTGGYQSKPFFRFPYGDYDASALDILGELGYSYTMWWSCDTQGWNGYTPDEIVALCGPENEKDGGEGAIILMHVADDNDWAALEPLIQDYQDAGYSFVTLEEMIQP
jgi:peptidoglycan/xylan/chitin deacetylase (PgdA/CDA1 family)